MEGYDYQARDLAELLLRKFFPERTDRESGVIRDWLLNHGSEYDRFQFSVRVGIGQTPAADLPPGVRRSVEFSSKKRIDVLAWQGNTPTIVEVKERIVPAVLGQLITYRKLLLEELPNTNDPILVSIGRYSDPDTLGTLAASGVSVFLYPLPAPGDAEPAPMAPPISG